LNPIQVNCPGCQKLYFVRPEDLVAGEPRFQCTSCNKMFAFTWPQPPEISKVHAWLLKGSEAEKLKSSPTVSQPTVRAVRTCVRCGQKVDFSFTECPKCGVIFDRVKKVRGTDPVIKISTIELAGAWDTIRDNYENLSRHEEFIQQCMAKENLAFASAQYRAVLDGNPSDDIANKMQNRIIELATFSYITAKSTGDSDKPRYAGFTKLITILAMLFIVTGALVSYARPLLPLGGAILVFVLTARHFAKS
jgi:hypothetical protein